MATQLPQQSLTINAEDRTWRFQCDTPKGQAPQIEIFRETIRTNAADGAVISVDKNTSNPVRRTIAGALLPETVTLHDGTVISIAHIAEALPMFFDQWRSDDVAAAQDES